MRSKGLTLLGFKPLSALKDWHQLSPSRFVYPDERAVKGSTAAFAALHAACQPQTSKQFTFNPFTVHHLQVVLKSNLKHFRVQASKALL